jgi:hypothetical protein
MPALRTQDHGADAVLAERHAALPRPERAGRATRGGG